MTTTVAFKEFPMAGDILVMTPITFLAGVVGSNIDHSYRFESCFVLKETLQFPEGPIMHPLIVFSGLSNVGQVLQYQYVTFGQFLNDSFGNIVVNPSHKPFPPTTDTFQLAFRGRCAFGLEFSHQLFPSNKFLFDIAEEISFTCHCQSIHSEIDTQNFTVVITVRMTVDFFRKGQIEEKPPLVQVKTSSSIPHTTQAVSFL
jgi:hypothetical protein